MKRTRKKPGPKPGNGKGSQTTSVSISFTPAFVVRMDEQRGGIARGKWIEGMVK